MSYYASAYGNGKLKEGVCPVMFIEEMAEYGFEITESDRDIDIWFDSKYSSYGKWKSDVCSLIVNSLEDVEINFTGEGMDFWRWEIKDDFLVEQGMDLAPSGEPTPNHKGEQMLVIVLLTLAQFLFGGDASEFLYLIAFMSFQSMIFSWLSGSRSWTFLFDISPQYEKLKPIPKWRFVLSWVFLFLSTAVYLSIAPFGVFIITINCAVGEVLLRRSIPPSTADRDIVDVFFSVYPMFSLALLTTIIIMRMVW